MDFLNLNESVKTAIRVAQGIAREFGNGSYAPAHLLKALLHKEIGLRGFIASLDKDIEYIEEWAEVRIEACPKTGAMGDIVADSSIATVFEEADNVRLKWGLLEVNPLCVFAAIVKPGIGFEASYLKSFSIRENEIHDLYLQAKETKSKVVFSGADEMSAVDGGGAITSLLKYCIDKTAMAAEGLLYPITGRDSESRMMIEILGRHSRPNVLITGESGVGKTALVDGLAVDIYNKKVPTYLHDAVVYELDTGALVAGATYKGEIEDRLKGIIKDIRKVNRAILFIDDIHVLLDPKLGNSGAGGILKPELSRGDLTVIGATSIDEYRKVIEPDQAFNRRFEVLTLTEPPIEVAARMVELVMARYVEFHKLKIDHTAVLECVRMAKRYVKDRKLPDAAIDLIDRTMSAVKMINETAAGDIHQLTAQLAEIEGSYEKTNDERIVALDWLHQSMQRKLSPVLLGVINCGTNTKEITTYEQWSTYLIGALNAMREFTKQRIETIGTIEIAAVISNKTGIPIGKIQSGEKERLMGMEEILRRRVIGQDNALKSLTDAILESRSGMNKPGQPIGSFFLLGPTGTGKTELAKALAETLFNDEKAMIRFDMSEFKEEHSAALLYGAPPGYVGYEEGGMLVNKIRQQPYAVVLFDEIEKAHASVYDIFLQVMDEGKLHDRLGKEGDFSNAIILFTSNVGSQWLMQQKEAGKTPTTTQLMDVMSEHFRPEFLARLSEIVPFSPINEQMLLKIFDIQLQGVVDVLDKQGITFEMTVDAKQMLAHKGFTPRYGARQVAGTIRNYVRRPISKFLIANKLVKGDALMVSVDENQELVWDIKNTINNNSQLHAVNALTL